MAGFTFQRMNEVTAAKAPGDKRRHPRIERGVLAMVTQGSNPPLRAEALASELSLSGIRLIVPRPLHTDLPVTLNIQLPADTRDRYMNQQPLSVQAEIRWQREEGGQLMCGLEFQNPTPAQRDRLAEVFAFYKKASTYGR